MPPQEGALALHGHGLSFTCPLRVDDDDIEVQAVGLLGKLCCKHYRRLGCRVPARAAESLLHNQPEQRVVDAHRHLVGCHNTPCVRQLLHALTKRYVRHPWPVRARLELQQDLARVAPVDCLAEHAAHIGRDRAGRGHWPVVGLYFVEQRLQQGPGAVELPLQNVIEPRVGVPVERDVIEQPIDNSLVGIDDKATYESNDVAA
mmetsp:Transcript_17429/g.52631  ORF Transcript_17429/g.52631 Transcript_17429/m.52631 type:complete len:203 (-) Transcript_17429:680-1288(-)